LPESRGLRIQAPTQYKVTTGVALSLVAFLKQKIDLLEDQHEQFELCCACTKRGVGSALDGCISGKGKKRASQRTSQRRNKTVVLWAIPNEYIV
jgi:hypothetical protein